MRSGSLGGMPRPTLYGCNMEERGYLTRMPHPIMLQIKVVQGSIKLQPTKTEQSKIQRDTLVPVPTTRSGNQGGSSARMPRFKVQRSPGGR